ncbi:unnamed protein product [Callosobruchus maculatus]|uniref:Cation/H+ exchanger transmembrane domain-containing protein n=1 Tax=Callosobruchus maculatus TaxID=64391 RepID=A0A653BNU2_CALMS|nr:unnamed protein product [Callosobruchus maculatus]
MLDTSSVEPHHPEPIHGDPTSRSRRVSIADGHGGHDNLGFDPPSRKISVNSDHVDVGPVRKKSILHKAGDVDSCSLHGRPGQYFYIQDSGTIKHHQANGDNRCKKLSTTDSMHSRATRFSDVQDTDRSWWYSFCLKCRSKDEGVPSWSPPFWHRLCPYPFCPTYRQFTRIVALSLIGVLTWCVVYAIVGDTAAPPNGHLFQLIVLSIAAHFGGWLMSLTTLPALIGMLFTGVLLQNIGLVNIDSSFQHITKELRNIALVIILIRAGLDLDPSALRRLKFSVIKVGLIPWFVEVGLVTILSALILHIPWDYAVLMGAIVGAVSPAVVVPCLFRLRSKGYGVAKGIPTLIIAVAGIDDAVSVAVFGIIKSIMFSPSSLTSVIIQGPASIVGGIGFGVLWGSISYYAPERNDPFVVPLRVLMLLVGGTVAVFGSELIGYGGAGPLGCVSAAFVSLVFWCKQGWEIEDNPAATAFEIFWMIFEPILFGLTGASIKINELDGPVVSICVGILLVAILIRMLSTVVCGIGCKLNLKEKLFVAFACMSKATVQAALGPVTLGVVAVNSVEHEYAEKILSVCILSIILTAPTSAILITLLGPRLLTKTKFPVVPEGWRRSHRPSIRDISIIDEEEERDETVDVTCETTDTSVTKLEHDSDSAKHEV